jgi:hypothetical protein
MMSIQESRPFCIINNQIGLVVPGTDASQIWINGGDVTNAVDRTICFIDSTGEEQEEPRELFQRPDSNKIRRMMTEPIKRYAIGASLIKEN